MSDTRDFRTATRSEPRHKDLLISYDPAVEASYFEHDFGLFVLEGRIVQGEPNAHPWILSVHGARADYTKADFVTLGLRDRGYSTLGISLSGHSAASGVPLRETTLGSNIAEAEAFYSYLDTTRKRKIIAYSLGGTPAVKVLGAHSDEVDRIVLFGPGMYDTRAYLAPFGRPFGSVIRRPFSYLDNDLLPILRKYRGRLLLIMGEYDGLEPTEFGLPAGGAVGEMTIDGVKRYSPIPREVIDLIYTAVSPARRGMIVVPGADHAVVPWLRGHPEQGAALLDEIADFLRD
ncbi:alpha/beta hydrolase [Nocardia sp. CA-129566]|uniref:alpha/beta hydrolase n=1 Tax=Nocardia sp. CA-129566 TaxID=3239976 RepID=UPI003D99C62E